MPATSPHPDVTDILLVDDSGEDAALTLRELRRSRVVNRVHHVRDGAAALQFLFDWNPVTGTVGWETIRLIILDLDMPRIGGVEFADASA